MEMESRNHPSEIRKLIFHPPSLWVPAVPAVNFPGVQQNVNLGQQIIQNQRPASTYYSRLWVGSAEAGRLPMGASTFESMYHRNSGAKTPRFLMTQNALQVGRLVGFQVFCLLGMKKFTNPKSCSGKCLED